MERDIVFAHKLVELYVFRVLPPLLPMVRVACSDRYITDWGIKPDVEDLVSKLLKRNLRSPFKITGDAAAKQALFKHGLCKADGVLGPRALYLSFRDPLF